ncbi:unnamed protein product [Fructobacillus tropaeoli]|nr:unnamed protein product [Fructobacillus tropaeoli]
MKVDLTQHRISVIQDGWNVHLFIDNQKIEGITNIQFVQKAGYVPTLSFEVSDEHKFKSSRLVRYGQLNRLE